MALQTIAQAENATLSVDVSTQGVVTAVEVSVPGPKSARVQVINPAGQSVRDDIILTPQAVSYRYTIVKGRQAAWDDSDPNRSVAWSYVFGTA